MIYIASLCYILFGVWRRLSLDFDEIVRFGEPVLWQEPKYEIRYFILNSSDRMEMRI